ncbi:CocE/NonD family hydrolase [Streptomyces prunicolor]|uniref:CocE/NonD family hydrolase n=1 Tax=Streptomyces prunicolor TaxID=67348 RepID=A0ABU4F5I0_9ACTN|nr:CocE/NonD family hydrolase [Streptomyces prunicolor]MDV7215836.1 CocE/NonD family hydrolase [Streptomyces prunicolor]
MAADEEEWQRVPLPGERTCWRRVLRMPVRDGALLVADLYADRPDPGPGPVILERTPYGRRATRPSDGALGAENPPAPETAAEVFTRGGYRIVRQDCRGRGDSEGTFVKYLNEAADGYDTVEWIAAQPWCDGRVATMGVSYSAHAQAALASLGAPHLAAMFLDSGGFASAYEAGTRMGGAFELKQATWAFHRAKVSETVRADPTLRASLESEDLGAWFTRMPWRRGASPLRFVPEYEDYLLEQWENGAFGPYWEQPGIYARGFYDDFPDVPSLHMSSWYDPYIRTATENFRELGRKKHSPAYLVLGPWTHGARSQSHAGDVDFGPRARLEGSLAEHYAVMRLSWFDAHLAPAGTTEPPPPVRYFLMGGGSGRRTAEGRLDHGGHWCTATSWPPEETAILTLVLGSSGTLTPASDTTDATDAAADAQRSFLEYDFDPRDPVPTLGGQVTSGEPVMSGGAFHQHPDDRFFGVTGPHLPLDSRPDVLVFQTPPLTEDLAVIGPVAVHLTVSSTAHDTDFTVKLVDVHPPSADYPQGFAMNLTDGILRCRYRGSFSDPEPMTPGETYAITVEAPDTANLFLAGHRLRLDVSSSNFPRFDVNSNTGGAEIGDRRKVVATNRVHTGGRSWLTLSVRPRELILTPLRC